MRLVALALVLALGACQEEDPGLLVHVGVPAAAVGSLDQVVVTLESASGSLGALPADTSESGITVHTEQGKVQLRLAHASFRLGETFDFLVVPTGAAPVAVNMTGTLLEAAGKTLGTAAPAQGTLDPGRRTRVDLTFACARADCTPVAGAGYALDLAAPSPSVTVTTYSGASDGDKLVGLGVGHFSTTGGDLVVGSPGKGEVYVFYGSDWTVPGHPTALDTSSADVTIVGKTGETLGNAGVSGDFDGDGVDDLVVTAVNAANPAGKTGAGAAYLISGVRLRAGGTIDLAATPADMAVYGEGAQERLGSSAVMAHVGSASRMDLFLGAPGAAGAGGATQGGRVYVVFGTATPLAAIVAVDPATGGGQDATILGALANTPIGLALAAGDLDGDGKADLVIGNYLDGGKGAVHVVKGARLTLNAAIDLSQTFDLRVTGTTSSQLGWAVDVADLDGNGTPDLVAGARQAGVVYAFAPALAGGTLDVGQNQFDLAITGPPSTSFGALLTHGNVDGDAAADLLIGAPNAAGPDGARARSGACHLVLGSQLGAITAGEHRTIALASAPAALTVYGAAANHGLCDNAALGNVDPSDPLDEILVGAAAGGTNARGIVYALQNLPTQ
jgi:hypothetical protein